MGMWDEFCLVCGGPPDLDVEGLVASDSDPSKSSTPPLLNASDFTWLESFVGISDTEVLISLSSYDDYGGFETAPSHHPTYTYFRLGCRDEDSEWCDAHGYACHAACYALLQQELHYTLKYADVRPLLVDAACSNLNKFAWCDYGGLAEYHDQWLCEAQLVEDGKLWMIEDPRGNEKNRERILGIWRGLVETGFQRPGGSEKGGGNEHEK